jgi:large subunit ribosomal protein L3
VQVGFGAVKPKSLTKPQRGHLAGAGQLVRHLREFSADNPSDYKVGDVINADLFNVGQIVDVTGQSKGRGFQGVMKRHGFGGGPRTHGQSDRARAPGSIGAGTDPGHVFKNTRMAGRMGGRRVTVQNLEVVEVISDRNLLLVRGSVPGAKNGLIMVRRAAKGRN